MGLLTRGALRSALAFAIACALAGCIGTSPEQAQADALGPDTGRYEEGPLHRAGFPCTRCHGEQWWQESPTFELAGTVYGRSGDREGVDGAEVVVEDAAGHELRARTNRAGNFFFERGGSQPVQRGEGRFEVPFALEFPLRVRVLMDGQEQVMHGAIWRERSCAACHAGAPGADSNGPVFAFEVAP
jgi:hypothetical protein